MKIFVNLVDIKATVKQLSIIAKVIKSLLLVTETIMLKILKMALNMYKLFRKPEKNQNVPNDFFMNLNLYQFNFFVFCV